MSLDQFCKAKTQQIDQFQIALCSYFDCYAVNDKEDFPKQGVAIFNLLFGQILNTVGGIEDFLKIAKGSEIQSA